MIVIPKSPMFPNTVSLLESFATSDEVETFFRPTIMNLTDEQNSQIAKWVAEELNLSQIQQTLSEEFDLKLTYMDTRFLIDDLDLTLAEQRPPATEATLEEPGPESAPGEVAVDVDK